MVLLHIRFYHVVLLHDIILFLRGRFKIGFIKPTKVFVVVAVVLSCSSQVIFGGIQALIAVLNWYPSCNCIIIKIDTSSSVTVYPQLACGAANLLHLRYGE